MRLSNIQIHRKLILLVIIMVCGTLVTAGLAYRFTVDDILDSQKSQIKSVVQAGISQIRALDYYRQQRALSHEQYQRQLREMIYATRFSGNEYLYLYDLNGTTIAHPILRHLEGRNQIKMQDNTGKFLIRDMIIGVQQHNELFWEFNWPKPEGGPPMRKLGYAQRVPGTDLILGSGIYLADLTPVYQSRAYTYIGVTFAVLLIALLASFRVARNITAPIGRLSRQMNALAKGDIHQAVTDTSRHDEIGEMACAVQCFQDHIIENQRLNKVQDQVTFLETFDPVTHLFNRHALGEAINKEITRHNTEGDQLAVVVLRLDLLHEISIEMGGERRDQVLTKLSGHIHKRLHADDILARLSEDTFGLLLPNVLNRSELEKTCRNLLDVLATPMQIDQHYIQLSARAGISLFPADGGYDFQLIGRAETTATQAKKLERDLLFYDALSQHEADHSIELWQEMQKALEEDQFYLVFQPLFHLANNELISAEVLLRWEHPEKGFISPAQFIPLAEQSGLIARLDAWVLEAAAKQIRCWLERQLTPPRIAVNLSGISFLRADFIDTLQSIFERHQVPLNHLELELTEGVLIDDLERITHQLSSIRATGVSISIDDFGTGYSSLSRIKNLAIDNIKIDRAFIDDLDSSTQNRKIVEAIILMAQGLNLHVIAEGVETQEQLSILRQTGCDTVQGFFLSRPLKVDSFEDLLEQDLVIEAD
ncbi:MAG: EAL domain-containing protein [Pontibacterium sp.]